MRALATRLVQLQLPFVYLMAIAFGLAIHGSEFGAASGRTFLVGLPLICAIALAPERFARSLAPVARPLALVGVLVAGWAYQPLHFAWWDERSFEQALRLVALGVITALVSSAARGSLRDAGFGRGSAAALAAVGAMWFGAWWQPMLPFLALACGFALFAAIGPPREDGLPAVASPALSAGWWRFLALLSGLDLTLPAWDWQTVPGAAPQLAAAFVAAGAVAAGVSSFTPIALRIGAVGWCASFLWAALEPSFALSLPHAAIAGGGLGALLRLGGPRRSGLPYWSLLGLLLAHILTQHLAFAGLRILLLLPLVFLLPRRASRTEAST